VSIYRKKFDATPDDLVLLKKITKILDDKNCQNDPLYFEATKKLYQLEPSPESAYLIGKMLLNEGKYAEAIEFLKEADKLEDPKMIEKSYMYIAQAYRAMNNFPSSRTYALKVAALNPSNGDPYILIGDLYAESAKDCGDNDLTSRVAFWAAVDKYYKAKQVDPSKAEEADKKINTYSLYFPPVSTIFFYTLKEGDTYRVECWINEDTKIRGAKQ
jgi:tetratricopeptide (TPR) repeat protein